MKSSFITAKMCFSRGQQTNIFTLQHINSTGRLSENLLMLPLSIFSPSGGNATATQHGAWLQPLPVRDCLLRWDHYYMSFPLNPPLLHLLISLVILPSISIYCLHSSKIYPSMTRICEAFPCLYCIVRIGKLKFVLQNVFPWVHTK